MHMSPLPNFDILCSAVRCLNVQWRRVERRVGNVHLELSGVLSGVENVHQVIMRGSQDFRTTYAIPVTIIALILAIAITGVIVITVVALVLPITVVHVVVTSFKAQGIFGTLDFCFP